LIPGNIARILVLACVASASAAAITCRVKLTSNDGGKIVDVQVDQYIAGVLQGEGSVFRSQEAMKAMAVVARTYAARFRGRHSADGYDFCSTTHCQRFDMPSASSLRLAEIVNATRGDLLWYEGRPALAVYSRDCGGTAKDVGSVWPDIQARYLHVHHDPYCLRNGARRWSWNAGADEITRALGDSRLQYPRPLTQIQVLDRTGSNRAKTVRLEGDPGYAILSASSFRFAIGRNLGWNLLRSNAFLVEQRNGRLF
jgi:stage II sporulation protein D